MGRKRERGVALVVVLWGLVLLAITAAGVASGSRTSATLARIGADNAMARAIADAGMYRAVLGMIDRRSGMRWRADGTEYPLTLDDGKARITIQDEMGKIDLNAAPDALVRAVLTGVGVEDETADALVDAIADFRDKDDLKRLNGAEDSDYSAAGRTYGPKNARFETVDELRRVLGVTPEIYRRLAPMVTVYSGRRGINPVTAPHELLLALPGGDPAQIDDLMAERTSGAEGTGPAILQAIQKTAGISFSSTSSYATIATLRSEARLATGAVYIREAIIRITGRPASPFLILAWRQGSRRAMAAPVQ